MKNSAAKIGKLAKSFSLISKKKLNVALLLVLASQVALSIYLCDFTWLASFGGLLTVLGLLLVFSQSFLAEYESEAESLHNDDLPEQLVLGGAPLGDLITSRAQIEKILDDRRKNFESKYSNIYYYLLLTVGGTLLWAYAGFLNNLFR